MSGLIHFVIPAKAGIQFATAVAPLWIPAFAGMTWEGMGNG
ncbi:hypothetical protein BPTFM16_00809 [Altererythrobacter insulae]|nr:hypothetical protein BPTFM16_00809 [Altererythrobacter insulae]